VGVSLEQTTLKPLPLLLILPQLRAQTHRQLQVQTDDRLQKRGVKQLGPVVVSGLPLPRTACQDLQNLEMATSGPGAHDPKGMRESKCDSDDDVDQSDTEMAMELGQKVWCPSLRQANPGDRGPNRGLVCSMSDSTDSTNLRKI
jgi:hypothetical protein